MKFKQIMGATYLLLFIAALTYKFMDASSGQDSFLVGLFTIIVVAIVLLAIRRILVH